jgi:hypothetical protein
MVDASVVADAKRLRVAKLATIDGVISPSCERDMSKPSRCCREPG